LTPNDPYRRPDRAQCAQTLELLDRYVSNELEPAERAVVEGHLEQCALCRSDLAERRRVRDTLRSAVAGTPVPAGLADAIRARRNDAPARVHFLSRPVTRWTAAVAATILVAFGAWMLLRDRSHKPVITEGMTPSEIQLATVLSVGLTDHIECAVESGYGREVFTEEKILAKLDDDYAGLADIVRAQATGYRLTVGHHCSFGGRDYVHLILHKGPSVISLAITEHTPADTLPDPALAATAAQGLPIYASHLEGYEVAGFRTGRFLVFAISDLSRAEHLALASALAEPVGLFLRGVPA
jgi:anti-sigma factor RsiW